jgi:hypothetical protein
MHAFSRSFDTLSRLEDCNPPPFLLTYSRTPRTVALPAASRPLPLKLPVPVLSGMHRGLLRASAFRRTRVPLLRQQHTFAGAPFPVCNNKDVGLGAHEDSVHFDPEIHLQLEEPEWVANDPDDDGAFGYAATFRVLSDAGVAAVS